MSEFTLIRDYLNHKNPALNTADYFKKFTSTNVIVNAFSNRISFNKKKSGLTLKCAFNGYENYETDSCKFRIDDNSYLVLNRDQQYSGYVDSFTTVETFSLFFEKSIADNVLGSLLIKSYEDIIEYYESGGTVQPIMFIEKTYSHDNIISPILFSLRNQIRNNNVDNFYLEEKFHLILSLLFYVHKSIICEIRSFPSIKPSTKIELYKRLCKAKDFIDASFDENISLNRVSAIACLSPHHFLRLFRKTYSRTPYQYLIFKRLEYSKKLLVNTDLNITEISINAGYENLSSFSRLFKQHFSISPEIYRNLKKTKKSISVK